MTNLEKKLRKALQRLGVEEDSTVVAGVSGGADSTALLDALVRLRDRDGIPSTIIAAHLNHLLRGEESEQDQKFVGEIAGRLKVRTVIERMDVARAAGEQGANLEATAGRLRYEFLQRCAEDQGAGFVITAHTRDDQAETVLMRVMRGAGVHGLRGIHRNRQLRDNVRLIRPLLSVSRSEVLGYCERYGLDFRTDSSNYSIDLQRNRIRHELIPLLRTFNPKIDEALARIAAIMDCDADFLDIETEKLLDSAANGKALDIKIISSAHPALRVRALRLWLENLRGSLERIDAKHMQAIDDLITRGQSGRSVELPGGLIVSREFDTIHLVQHGDRSYEIPERSALIDGIFLDFGAFNILMKRGLSSKDINLKKLDESGCHYIILNESAETGILQVRTRKPGDGYVPRGSRNRVKLKTLMIRNKIQRSLRDTYPILVTSDDEIIWAPGLPVAEQHSAPIDRDGELILITAQIKGEL